MKKLNQLSGMPQMKAAFSGWTKTITLTRVTQTVVDALVTQTEYDVAFRGTIQPLSPKQISLKPEGQRAWKWLQIHCVSGNLNLTTNDRIKYNGDAFKIMAVLDYSLNGYIEYHAVKDYEAVS